MNSKCFFGPTHYAFPKMCCMFAFYLWITWPAFYIFNKKKTVKLSELLYVSTAGK